MPGEQFHPGRGTLSQSGMGNLLWSHLGKGLCLDDIDGLSRDATIRGDWPESAPVDLLAFHTANSDSHQSGPESVELGTTECSS